MPKEIKFGPFESQLAVRAKLTKLIENGEVSEEEAIKIYKNWKEKRLEPY